MKKNCRVGGVASGGLAAVALLGVSMAYPADAQSVATAAAADAKSDELETIIVSAERRSERLQDVPITITNISAGDLEKSGSSNLADISNVTPGLRFDYAGNFVQPTIRGVGTALALAGGSSNVGTYIDGFISPNPAANDFQLLNVDSIQVLKGPQGTLFGRNTTGGAILVNSSKPSFDTNIIGEVSYGNFNTQKYQAYFTSGIASTLAFDIAGSVNKGNGFTTNVVTDDDDAGRYRNWSVRTGLLFTPTDELSFLFRYTHQGINDPTNLLGIGYVVNGVSQLYARFIPGAIYSTDPNQISVTEPIKFVGETNIFQLTSSWDPGPVTVTSYTQYRAENTDTYETLDYSSAQLLDILIPVHDHTFTQEFLVASKPGPRLQYTAGAFFSNTSDDWPVQVQVFGAPYTPSDTGTVNKSVAAYADLTYQLTDSFFVTAGLRVTHDEVQDAHFENTNNPLTYLPTLKNNKGTPRVVLRYSIDTESSVYASFSKGYKAGLYNVGGAQRDPVAAENLNAYEVGYKFAEHGFSADASAFYYDYKNIQVESYGTIDNEPTSFVSPATGTLYGFDGDIRYEIFSAWEVNAGVNYTHSAYKSFPDSPTLDECLSVTACGPAYGLYLNGTEDAHGNSFLRTPKFTGNLGTTYTLPIAASKLALSGNLYSTSQFFFDSSHQLEQGGYTTLGLRAEWTDPSGLYKVALFGNNVTDKRYSTQTLGNTFGIGTIWAYPATYGVSLNVRLR